MNHPFLVPVFLTALGWMVAASGACGGKVVVDSGSGGSGGQGGATTNATATNATATNATATVSSSSCFGDDASSSVVSSTTTGVMSAVAAGATSSTSSGQTCNCMTLCAVAEGCGFPGTFCTNLCGDLTPSTMQCLCENQSCGGLQQCLGGGGNGSAAASTGAG
jgi:hypothetical protein